MMMIFNNDTNDGDDHNVDVMIMMIMIMIGNITMTLMQTIAMDERELVMYNNIFPKLQVIRCCICICISGH